jgi:modulator of FtsH protease
MNVAYDPPSWQNFYLMTGGAAAALTGLLFVAMSLHAKTITGDPFYMRRAVGTLASLTTQLLIAAGVLVPGQSLTWLGIEVEIGGAFFLAFSVNNFLRSGGYRRGFKSRSRTQAAIELAGGSTWVVLLLATGISLLVHAGGGFYLLAVVMAFMFAWNIYVAWTLITEVSE